MLLALTWGLLSAQKPPAVPYQTVLGILSYAHFWHECVLFPHTDQFFNSPHINWVSNNSHQFWHCLLGVSITFHKEKSLGPQDSPIQMALQVVGQAINSLFEWQVINLLFFYHSFLRFFNLPRCLTELKKAFYLHFQFYCKGYKWVVTRGGRFCPMKLGGPDLLAHGCTHCLRNPNIVKRLIKLYLQHPIPCPEALSWGLKFQPPN